jgi:hypothetical protein
LWRVLNYDSKVLAADLKSKEALMAWLFGVVLVLLLVFSAGFRKLALGLAGIVLVMGIAVFVNDEIEEKRALERIPLGDLGFENFLITPIGNNFTLSGRVNNRSTQYTLTGMTVAVALKDCQIQANEEPNAPSGQNPSVAAGSGGRVNRSKPQTASAEHQQNAPADDTQCVTIGEVVQKLPLTVPPGQARDFDNFVAVQGSVIKPRGQLKWSYSVRDIKGR